MCIAVHELFYYAILSYIEYGTLEKKIQIKPPYLNTLKGLCVCMSLFILQERAMEVHLAHNQEVVGSNPAPASTHSKKLVCGLGRLTIKCYPLSR